MEDASFQTKLKTEPLLFLRKPVKRGSPIQLFCSHNLNYALDIPRL